MVRHNEKWAERSIYYGNCQAESHKEKLRGTETNSPTTHQGPNRGTGEGSYKGGFSPLAVHEGKEADGENIAQEDGGCLRRYV